METKKLNPDINTIKNLCESIRNYEKIFEEFQENPSGENYKTLEYRRKDLFTLGAITLKITFPDTLNEDEKEAIKLGREILRIRRLQEAELLKKDI